MQQFYLRRWNLAILNLSENEKKGKSSFPPSYKYHRFYDSSAHGLNSLLRVGPYFLDNNPPTNGEEGNWRPFFKIYLLLLGVRGYLHFGNENRGSSRRGTVSATRNPQPELARHPQPTTRNL